MTQQQLLLRLQDLDGQMSRLEEQRQRNGLSAYEERLKKVADELKGKSERFAYLEVEVPRGQQALGLCEKQAQELEKSISQSTSYDTALLRNQMEPLRGKISELEDLSLAQMLELEELQPQLPPLRDSLAEIEAELEEARPEEQERLDNLAMRLGAMARERAELTAQLPAEVLSAYAKSGRVDEVKQGRCRCRLEVPDHYLRQLRAGHAWVCNTCGSLIVQNLKP
jgi:predicted  nucleic acid-binding Zn-ribbon protein